MTVEFKETTTWKRILNDDYYYALVPGHPYASKHNYVFEHRIVKENQIGRYLIPGEIVHHINGNKKDNRPENLEILTQSKHMKSHKRDTKMVDLLCPQCRSIFSRVHRQTHLAKKGLYTACSRECNGKFIRYMQINGKDEKVNSAILNNVIIIYKTLNNSAAQSTSVLTRESQVGILVEGPSL